MTGPIYERITDQHDPVPLAWSADGLRLAVGGSAYRYDLPGEEFPPVTVLDATRPCSPPVARLPAPNPRTRYFAQRIWLSEDGTTVTVCSEVQTARPRGSYPRDVALHTFRESAGVFGEARELLLEQDYEHFFSCHNVEPTPAALFVYASDGLLAFSERAGRPVELAREPDLGVTSGGVVYYGQVVASPEGRRLAVSVPLPWAPPDGRAEPASVHLLSFSADSGFGRIASFNPDVAGWPPRGWQVDLVMWPAGFARS